MQNNMVLLDIVDDGWWMMDEGGFHPILSPSYGDHLKGSFTSHGYGAGIKYSYEQ